MSDKTTTVAELEKLINDLDEARATGVVYTYGMIQERIRAIITHA